MLRAVVLVLLLAIALTARAEAVSVKQGKRLGARIFPSDAFTTKDKRQLTGRRLAFKLGRDYPVVKGKLRRRCTNATYSICDTFGQLNRLDGFDPQPRVAVPFTGRIDLESVSDKTVFISTRGGKFASGVRQLTFDPETNTLAGISEAFLREGTRYRVHVTRGVRDAKGKRVKACRKVCVSRFTTRTATGQLVRIRRAIEKLPASTVSFTQDGKDDVFTAGSIAPSVAAPLDGIVRADQVMADPQAEGAFRESAVPNLIPPGNAGFFAFGSFESPRYQFASKSAEQDKPGSGRTDGEIPPVPSRRTPRPLGADRLTAIVVTPNPAMHPPPWPAAVYGPGFTRSAYDIFVSADFNASRGILTVATDPSGHGFGSESKTTVTSNGVPTTFRHFGRGRDLDGDGEIGSGLNDGVGPTGHSREGKPDLPSRKPIDGLRSGLMQTVVDNMVLGRALKAGLDIPGVGTDLVDGDRLSYYGLSFGGIYGTMLMGTDPLFNRGLLNVPGGPIVDIARLSAFRGDLADQLDRARPDLRNGGPGLEGFTEDLPLRNEPPLVIEHDGATELQELFASTNWYDRSGSPETFAPRIRLRPDPAWADKPKEIAFQTAYGDGTVPNYTSGTLYRAGELFDRVTYYRNDKSPTFARNPHGFLADPTVAGRTAGQQQLAEFLATGEITNPNPQLLEFPIADPNNLECLHYADPQTGETQSRPPFPASGDCPAAPGSR
ncbi:MAG: hypothetical protein WKF94_18520 [Solirubrobacteraceae bacterium]